MPSSLRARLLAWYSLILAIVISTFAGSIGVLLWRARVADVDASLRVAAGSFVEALRPATGGGFDLDLPVDYRAADPAGTVPPIYYSLWNDRGALIDRSPGSTERPVPAAPGLLTRDGRRELTVTGANGALVLVGRDLADARDAVRGFAGTAALSGVAALVAAMAGGWFLVGRALAPVGRINDAAAAMAGGDLNARIAVDRTDNELEHVAHALNGAFDRLHHTLARQRRFTADASHELRTPVATIAAETEWALARPRLGGEYVESLVTCRRAAERMTQLVERLLTLARADHNVLPIDRAPVELDTLVRDVLVLIQPIARRRDIAIETTLAPAVLEGDREHLAELITNLCGNAVEHNRDGGHVAVDVRIDGRDVLLRVSDTGVGISETDLPRLFEPFYRPDAARSRRRGGAGLGLAIAKWIVDAHHGDITCRSRLGHGTDILVRLPQLGFEPRDEHVELG